MSKRNVNSRSLVHTLARQPGRGKGGGEGDVVPLFVRAEAIVVMMCKHCGLRRLIASKHARASQNCPAGALWQQNWSDPRAKLPRHVLNSGRGKAAAHRHHFPLVHSLGIGHPGSCRWPGDPSFLLVGSSRRRSGQSVWLPPPDQSRSRGHLFSSPSDGGVCVSIIDRGGEEGYKV